MKNATVHSSSEFTWSKNVGTAFASDFGPIGTRYMDINNSFDVKSERTGAYKAFHMVDIDEDCATFKDDTCTITIRIYNT